MKINVFVKFLLFFRKSTQYRNNLANSKKILKNKNIKK